MGSSFNLISLTCLRIVKSGGCPHAAIREDISANIHALEELQVTYQPELLFVESGGDNLAGKLEFKIISVGAIS
jgi:urease accessory protein